MLRALLILFMTCFIGNGYAQEMVITHSNMLEHYAKGKILDSRDLLQLPNEAEITVVFPSGTPLTLKGPFSGQVVDPTPQVADPTLVVELAQKIKTQLVPFEQKVLRGQNTSLSNESLWLVDIDSNKRYYCVPSTQGGIRLVRQEPKIAATLLIKHKPTEQQAQVVWPAYKTTLSWPDDLPVLYGNTYTLELTTIHGYTFFKKLVLYQLPDNLASDSHKVVWMAGKGCISQANMLLASLR